MDFEFDVNALADAWVKYQGIRNDSKSTESTIDQLKNTVDVYAATNRQLYDLAVAKQQENTATTSFNLAKMLPFVLLAGGAFVLYKLVK